MLNLPPLKLVLSATGYHSTSYGSYCRGEVKNLLVKEVLHIQTTLHLRRTLKFLAV